MLEAAVLNQRERRFSAKWIFNNMRSIFAPCIKRPAAPAPALAPAGPLDLYIPDPVAPPDQAKQQYKKKRIPYKLATDLWNIYIGQEYGTAPCPVCKLTLISQRNFECGHILSEANGGETSLNNLVPICGPCNRSIYTKNIHDYMREFGYGELAPKKVAGAGAGADASIEEWFNSKYIITRDNQDRVRALDIYELFITTSNMPAISQIALGKRINKIDGLVKTKNSEGVIYCGVKIK